MKKIDASPTKRFFVEMLTRDIDLKDAILDLLDNCVDGIVRSSGGDNSADQPYKGFYADIKALPKSFTITDNCGGIPSDVLTTSAFRQGRPASAKHANAHTVGMYGIGMKRAMFKLGRRSKLVTRNSEKTISVTVTPEWLEEDTNWNLQAEEEATPVLSAAGTQIQIEDLYESISINFSSRESDFLSDLCDAIGQQYARIIEKGFEVQLNGKAIKPVDLRLFFDPSSKEGVQPYIFQGTINNVNVDLVVGFHRRLASEKEIDEELVEPRKTTDAGWTIVCNDRVVLYKDRSRLTGWGLGNVPNYHTQHISISGQVEFRSTDLFNLPLNTTKRGVDTGSEVYLTILQEMMNGLKVFTDFTNKWKGKEQETNINFSAAEHGKPEEAIQAFVGKTEAWSSVRNISNATNARRFIPALPMPPRQNNNRRITFSRSTEQIRKVSEHLTGNPDGDPSEIGSMCFDKTFREAK